MTARASDAAAVECFAGAGLPAREIRDWLQAEPGETTDFPADREKFSGYWQRSARLLGRLPHKPRRGEREQAAAQLIQDRSRDARLRFGYRRTIGSCQHGIRCAALTSVVNYLTISLNV